VARPNGERAVYFGGNDMINSVSTAGSSRPEPRLYGIHDGQDSLSANDFRHAGSVGEPLAKPVRRKYRIRAGYH
jgi:hypothetical protein